MTLDHWKLIFGFAMLIILGVLAMAIALGHVTKDESQGLEIVLGCFATLSGGFANWCFTDKK